MFYLLLPATNYFKISARLINVDLLSEIFSRLSIAELSWAERQIKNSVTLTRSVPVNWHGVNMEIFFLNNWNDFVCLIRWVLRGEIQFWKLETIATFMNTTIKHFKIITTLLSAQHSLCVKSEIIIFTHFVTLNMTVDCFLISATFICETLLLSQLFGIKNIW